MDQDTKDLLKTAIAGQVRHSLTVAAGALIGVGALQTSQATEFESIGTGVAMWAVAAAWSWWQKKGQSDVNAAFKVLTANVKPASSTTTQGASK